MSSLKQRLSDEIKRVMKSGEKQRLLFARQLHAAIRKKEIDERVELEDEGVLRIVQTLLKQRQDSIEQFKKASRQDLVEKEEAEANFLKSFLPPPLSEQELHHWVDWAICESKAVSLKDLGAVMKLLLPQVQGRADPKQLNQWVREKIGS